MLLQSGLNTPIWYILAMVIIALISVVVHEYAHARVAFAMGDPTARDLGKMTLDPRANVNWIGLLMFVVIGFGPLGQVPVDERRMYNRRWGMFATVAAGPISNLILAVIFALPFILNITIPFETARVVILAVQFNVLLFVFNLLPMFPLDGWTMVLKLLPPELAIQWQRYRDYSTYALYGLVLLSFVGINLFSTIIFEPVFAITRLLIR